MRSKSLISKISLLALVFFGFVMSGCLKDKFTRSYTLMYPIYSSKSEVLASINSAPKETISNPGKIFLQGKYIFLNEIDKGVHIIDNSNPSKPTKVGFLKIPGNIDIAVNGSTLYADMYGDLLAIDISDPLHTSVKKLIHSVFPERIYASGFVPDPEKVIAGWIEKDTTVEIEKSYGNSPWPQCAVCSFALMSDLAGNKSSGGGAPGIAGSMARMSVVGNYLYAVNQSSLLTFSLADPSDPDSANLTNVGWNIETIYPFKDKLFIGSNSGMFIFNIDNPSNPQMAGNFSHVRSCDPVVADDKYAFVTLRSGNKCDGYTNQLDIVDVNNVSFPFLEKSYKMTNPHGLSKDGNMLFLCDGKDGLKVYDVSNVRDVKLLQHIESIETYDAIAWNKNLLVVCKDGLLQFDYSDNKNLRQISKISISGN